MASREAAKNAMTAVRPGRIKGYRRVLHPELSAGGSCGLCIAASTRTYKVKDLMPIHNLCKCEPVVIYMNADPGLQINEEDLAVLYGEAGRVGEQPGNQPTSDGAVKGGGAQLKRETYEVFMHPELGPVLRNKAKKRQKTDIKFSPREPKLPGESR